MFQNGNPKAFIHPNRRKFIGLYWIVPPGTLLVYPWIVCVIFCNCSAPYIYISYIVFSSSFLVAATSFFCCNLSFFVMMMMIFLLFITIIIKNFLQQSFSVCWMDSWRMLLQLLPHKRRLLRKWNEWMEAWKHMKFMDN